MPNQFCEGCAMTDEHHGEDAEYGLVMPFWIDTDGYSDRDRLMFCAGVEFEMVRQQLKSGWRGMRLIHRENESRLRLMCGKLGVRCSVSQHSGYEGCDVWSDMTVE